MNWRLPLVVCGLVLVVGSRPRAARSAGRGARCAGSGRGRRGEAEEAGAGSESGQVGQGEALLRPRRSRDRWNASDAERQGWAAADRRLRQDARDRQAAPARRKRLRPVAALHRRHRRRETDRGDQRRATRRPRPLRRRRAGLPLHFRHCRRRGPRPLPDHRLRVQGGRLPDEPWRPVGARRRRLEKDAAAIGKRRNEAEKAMARALRAIEDGPRTIPTPRPCCATRTAFPASGTRPAGLSQRKRARLLRREPHRGSGGAARGATRSLCVPCGDDGPGRQAGKEAEQKKKKPPKTDAAPQ